MSRKPEAQSTEVDPEAKEPLAGRAVVQWTLLLKTFAFCGSAFLWSRGGESVTRSIGAVFPLVCAAGIAWGARSRSTNAWRFITAVGVVGLLCCGAAELFERPGSVAALLDGLRIALAFTVACALVNQTWGRRTAFLLGTAAVAVFIGIILPQLSTGGRLEADAARAIAQTNVREALDYLRLGIRLKGDAFVASLAWLWAINTGFGAASGRDSPATRSLGIIGNRFRLLLATGALLLAIPALLDLATISVPVQTFESLAYTIDEYRRELAVFRRLKEARRSVPGAVSAVGELSEANRSILVIIGESTTRHHWSLYGYPRSTNAPLARWVDDLLLYSDVVSPHSHTVQVLEPVFTGMSEIAGSTEGATDLITVARAAGYYVSWLSAQNEFGIWDNVVRLIAEGANHRVFLDSSVSTKIARYARDQELLPELERLLSDRSHPRRITFVHMMGGHAPYCTMFDPKWVSLPSLTGREAKKLFGRRTVDLQTVDCYDKTMNYHSAVLDKMLELARRQVVDTVLYFPDHGEAPTLGTGHDSRYHVGEHVEIPFFWFLDQRYWANHLTIAEALRKNRDKPVLLSDLFHTLQELMGARSRNYLAERSLLQTNYVSSPRKLFENRFDYDQWSEFEDTVERTRANMRELAHRSPTLHRRVWAHRVDTLGKLQRAMELFAGVELDIVFESNSAFVFHPPAENLGLELRDYLRAASHRSDLQLWFDVKEPGPSGALERTLANLDSEFTLRSRTIVELPPNHTNGVLARDLARKGWRVSYYLVADRFPSIASRSDSRDTAEILHREREYILTHGFSFISYDVGERVLASSLVSSSRAREIGRLTWDLSWDPSLANFLLREVDIDESVVLVPFHSSYEN